MKRIRIVGLALVAVFAVGVVVASAASAMVEKNADFNKAGSNNKFTGESKLPLEPTLFGPGNTIVCKMDTSSGEDGGNGSMNVKNVVVHFTECEGTNNVTLEKCKVKSKGAPLSNLIQTATLDGELRRVLAKEATSEVGLELLPASGSEFVTLEGSCLEPAITKITGQITGEVTPVNAGLKLTGSLVFEASSSEQKIKKTCGLDSAAEFGALPCVAALGSPKLNAFGGPSFEMTTESLTFGEATEVLAH